MRLDKYLTAVGACSRREAARLIRAGRVTVDGRAAASGDDQLDPENARVCLDGRELEYSRFHYYMLNKPAGVITATEDGRQKTVLDLLPPELRALGLFPVGRLDKDTTGLLLLTDDGDFAHRVISPSRHVPKRYRAELDLPITEEDERLFKSGIPLCNHITCLPAELIPVSPDRRTVRVTVYEGKYHQVKRMFSFCGKTVLSLEREAVGALELDEKLLPGCYKKLTEIEKNNVFFTKE